MSNPPISVVLTNSAQSVSSGSCSKQAIWRRPFFHPWRTRRNSREQQNSLHHFEPPKAVVRLGIPAPAANPRARTGVPEGLSRREFASSSATAKRKTQRGLNRPAPQSLPLPRD